MQTQQINPHAASMIESISDYMINHKLLNDQHDLQYIRLILLLTLEHWGHEECVLYKMKATVWQELILQLTLCLGVSQSFECNFNACSHNDGKRYEWAKENKDL